jgi:hypothetical protein
MWRGVDIFYMVCMLRRMVACMGVGFTLEEERWALGGRILIPKPPVSFGPLGMP